MKIIFIMLSFCAWAFWVYPARILSDSGEPVPEITDKSQLVLVGQAQFSVLFWDIYQSRLYTSSGQFSRDEKPLLFEINYQKDISRRELLSATIEQWQHLAVAEQDYQQYIPRLEALWPDISAGDSLTLFSDHRGSYFYFNGNYLGRITDAEFAGLFLDIWLSPKTSRPRLRQDLLGIKP
ncbi:chalcone isomerase family protein [Thalassomonas viridans]|uniref:Chalcone isomerase family protein n=1 Tax=Thalassomonas viridans TaxID=137584 RepID=A0AAE9Z1A0_9GAMM|nr:chalcone isomerase family protein [Thalassomonas viridans]WDE04189.1 chalcone isomerase family protein [Thalassomonas viridans]